jgi:hypothetical protein
VKVGKKETNVKTKIMWVYNIKIDSGGMDGTVGLD